MSTKTEKPTRTTKPKKTAAKGKTKAKTSTVKTAKAPKTAKAQTVTIADTVRAVVDAAAAIVSAAVTVNAAVTAGKKKGRTARKVDRALTVAEGVTAAAVALVDLNRAAPDALVSLKHIGPTRARRIVEARPFQAVDDLAARKLLPKKAVDELRDKLSV